MKVVKFKIDFTMDIFKHRLKESSKITLIKIHLRKVSKRLSITFHLFPFIKSYSC